MTNKEAKKKINRKLKLYRNARIGEIAIGVTSAGLATGLTYLISEKLLVNINSIPIRLSSILGTSLISAALATVPIVGLVRHDNDDKAYIERLKELKKELKKDKINFKNINEDEFEEICKVKNKVK